MCIPQYSFIDIEIMYHDTKLSIYILLYIFYYNYNLKCDEYIKKINKCNRNRIWSQYYIGKLSKVMPRDTNNLIISTDEY